MLMTQIKGFSLAVSSQMNNGFSGTWWVLFLQWHLDRLSYEALTEQLCKQNMQCLRSSLFCVELVIRVLYLIEGENNQLSYWTLMQLFSVRQPYCLVGSAALNHTLTGNQIGGEPEKPIKYKTQTLPNSVDKVTPAHSLHYEITI